jgi:hypothetical protein
MVDAPMLMMTDEMVNEWRWMETMSDVGVMVVGWRKEIFNIVGIGRCKGCRRHRKARIATSPHY